MRQADTERNMDAVRCGYAYTRQNMHATRNYHVVHAEGTRRMYLCGCARGIIWPRHPSPLGKLRHKDDRWASDFRYRSRFKG